MDEVVLMTRKIVRYNLYGSIKGFDNYTDFIDKMQHYTHLDCVDIYINSSGGRTDVGYTLVNTIKNCQADIRCIVEAPSYSMASIIALAADDLIFKPDTFLMFHNYNTGGVGKGRELAQMIESLDEYENNMLTKMCSPFLTKKELASIKHDQDIYIKASDPSLPARIRRHFK